MVKFVARKKGGGRKKLTVKLHFPPQGNDFSADCRHHTQDILQVRIGGVHLTGVGLTVG